MTEASRPHVMCDASNLLIDPFRASKASCPKYRPGYLCHSPTYHRYARGAFALACDLPELRLEDFPRDHLQDIMESMEEVDAALLSKVHFNYQRARTSFKKYFQQQRSDCYTIHSLDKTNPECLCAITAGPLGMPYSQQYFGLFSCGR